MITVLAVSYGLDKLVYLGMNRISDKVLSGQSIGKLNHFLTVKDTTQLLIFGSSRANHHIAPTIFSESAYNMGVDGRSIAYYSTLIRLLPANRPQTLLINIDTEEVYDRQYLGDDIAALRPRYHRDPVIAQAFDQLDITGPLQKFYWSIDYNNKVLGIINNYLRPKYAFKTYDGFDPLVPGKEEKRIRNKVLSGLELKGCDDGYVENEVFKDVLKDLIDFCEENNKRVVFFVSPLYQDGCKEDNKLLGKLMSDSGIEFWDYTDFFKSDNRIELWKDFDHLSREGAMIFTEEIQRKMNVSR